MSRTSPGLLERIDSPRDLRALPARRLPELCDELRSYLIEAVSSCGGHFAAGLGAIEITVALHYVFDTPHDRLIWDVGHQCYPHKILTGRRAAIRTIRKRGGLAPFPSREESAHDRFGVGHSSTSIGAAVGAALAARARGERRQAVAVIGDGGMTAGMAFEALNHLGAAGANVLIVLNDNEMSISPNVGAMNNYLTRILSSRIYNAVVAGGRRLLEPLPPAAEFARRTQEHLKGMITPGTLFEELGVGYYGPVDGHDVGLLVETLGNLRRLDRPRLLHIVTRKGKGYPPAERDPVGYHAVGRFDPGEALRGGGERAAAKPAAPTYSAVFGEWLCDMAERDPRLVAITPAMREGSGLVEFERRFPDRYFDVGIAEQHAVTLAAGLACEGMKPVVAIYSTFLQRAYDQFVHDVALQNLPVLFAIDRAGLVGADGPTHTGSFDIAFLRCVPNIMLMTPSDEAEARRLLTTGFLHDGPAAVRYPRGAGPGAAPGADFEPLPIGRARVVRRGQALALLAFGAPLAAAAEVAATLDATLADMRFVKPLDERAVLELAAAHPRLVAIEDGVVAGGAGEAVGACLRRAGAGAKLLTLGLPDRFPEHATREEQLAEVGLDAAGIERSVRAFCGGR